MNRRKTQTEEHSTKYPMSTLPKCHSPRKQKKAKKESLIRGGWGDMTMKYNVVSRIESWNGNRTLVNKLVNPNELLSLVNRNVPSLIS